MSCVIVLTPVIIASWPTIAASIAVAAAAMGFAAVKEEASKPRQKVGESVDLEVPNVDAVGAAMGRDERIVVQRQGVQVIFSKDARGHLKTCVEGPLGKAELKAIGEELSQRVVQQYVYRRLQDELAAQGFVTVAEEESADSAIKLRVKRFGG